MSVLVNKIALHELQLPEMQGKYVWTATTVRDLLDLPYRWYPSESSVPGGRRDAWKQAVDFAVAAEAGGVDRQTDRKALFAQQ